MRLSWPKVSVVISTFKRPELLKKCVESVLDQDFDDFEVLVVDDGSATAKAALESLSKKADERGIRLVVLEMEENSGYQAAPKNIGISYARGSYIAHADDDDEWYPWHLSTLVEEIEKGGVDLVYSRWKVRNTAGKGPEDGSEWVWVPFNFLTARLILSGPQSSFISSHTLYAKGRMLDLLGPRPWDENVHRFGDWEMYKRALLSGARFGGVDKVTFVYNWHGENLQLTRPAGVGAGAIAV